MATDSSDLTFIRCPACKSLVPAMAPTCRMCGAPLEDGAADTNGSSSEASSGGRVRNQTVSASREDVEDALAPFTDLAEEPEEERDPLSDFLTDEPVQQESSSDFGEELPRSSDDPLGFQEPAASDAEEADDPFDHAPMVERAPVSELKRPGMEAKPEPLAPPIPEPEPQAVQEPVAPEAPQMLRPEPVQEMKEVEEPKEPVESPAPEPDQVAKVAAPANAGTVQGEEPVKSPTSGKLYAWFVSYDNSGEGESLEIRAGKFFVTSTALEATHLLVDHPSVSTPHALMRAGQASGLVVQDLMSDSGVLVRRAGSASFEKIEETTELRHGDWVKFGERSFLVSLVPSQ